MKKKMEYGGIPDSSWHDFFDGWQGRKKEHQWTKKLTMKAATEH